jgi:hypothetical protein
VPGFRGGDGRIDGFQVAHFTDQHDVRVLAQRAPQRLGKVRHVDPDLALGHQRLLVPVIIFNRVFDGDDMRLVPFLVDDVDHRGQGRRFSGAGRPGDQHQAPGFVEQFLRGRRQADLLHRKQLARDLAQDAAEIAFLLEDADSEPGHLAESEPKVGAATLAHVLNMIFRGDAAHQFLGVFRRQGGTFHPVQNAMDADGGRGAYADVQVGSTFRHHQLQQIGH